MTAQRHYEIDDNLMCYCDHSWKEHRKANVTNPKYLSYPLAINGMMAQQCEHLPNIRTYFADSERQCKCEGFRPRARNVQDIVDEWVKKNG